MILGKNLIMTLGDSSKGLACSKSCSLNVETEFLETCSPTSGTWREYLPTIKSWGASVDTLVAKMSDHKRLLQLQDSNTLLACCFYDSDLQEFYRGNCYIKNLQLKASVGGLATMSVTIQPTGKLTWAEEMTVDMSTGESSPRTLGLVNGTDTVTIMDRSGGGPVCMMKEIEITRDTRFTLTRAALINAPLETVSGWVTAKNNTQIAGAAIAVETSYKEKTVIVKTNALIKLTILQNNGSESQYAIKYLSKF